MASINKVILLGRVGKDPEIRSAGDVYVANFSVATSETWKDKRSGERKERTEWHNIVVWNEATINFIEQYVKKGDQVYIEGQLQTRSWEEKDTGATRYTTEVVVPAFGGKVELNISNDSGGRRDDDDADDRGRGRSSSRGGGRGRDDDDGDDRTERSSSRSSRRGSDDSGRSSSRGRGRDDEGTSSGRSGGRTADRGKGRSVKDDLDDDIPF